MSETTLTFRVDERLKEQFTAAAERSNRTVEEVLYELVRDFVEYETPAYDEWFGRKIQASLDSANAGRVVPAEEVEAKFAAKRAATLRKLRSAP